MKLINDKIIFYIIIFIFTNLYVFGQVPTNYYLGTENLKGEELRSVLFNKIKNHSSKQYNELWNIFKTTDVKQDGSVWDMYSGCNFEFVSDQCGAYNNVCDCYNREHSFPKSWFGGDVSPMNTDLFHLVPTDGYINGKRGNLPFGEVGSITYSAGGSKIGPAHSSLNYSGNVFEPADEYKGDFARIYFYMLTRYMDKNLNQSNNDMLSGNANFENWAIKMLLKWHEQDPVSQKEIDRNNKIYNDYQYNRNPFVDCPSFAYLIWDTDYSGQTCDFPIINSSENINENKNIKIFLSENNLINIETENNDKIIKINIYDIIGKIIITDIQNNNNQSKTKNIDINNFENGVYIVNVILKTGESFSEKIIKY